MRTLNPKQGKKKPEYLCQPPPTRGDQIAGSHGEATCLQGMNEGLDEGREKRRLKAIFISVQPGRARCIWTEEGGPSNFISIVIQLHVLFFFSHVSGSQTA